MPAGAGCAANRHATPLPSGSTTKPWPNGNSAQLGTRTRNSPALPGSLNGAPSSSRDIGRTSSGARTLAGWRALLTVHGASILAERPLLAVDLTGQHAAGMLSAAARDAGIPSVTYRLPHEPGRCGLLTELTPGQLADAIAESLHAGAPDGARADRAVDVWILQQLTGVLGVGGATPQRLAALFKHARAFWFG